MKLTPQLRAGLAILTIVICGLIELLFLGLLVSLFFKEKVTSEEVISPIFTMGIFAFPIWWGLKLWRSSKTSKALPVDSETATKSYESVNINGSITRHDYRKVIFLLTYTSPLFIFLHLIGIFFLVMFVSKGSWDWYTIFVSIFLLYLPIGVFRSGTRQYQSAKMLHEKISYTFTKENVSCEGQSFNCTVKWESFFKTKETGEFFLLYTNTSAAMVIPKHAFTSGEDLKWFKERISTIG